MSRGRGRDWDGGDFPPDWSGEEEDFEGRFSDEGADLAPLARISGRALRMILEHVDRETLTLALRGADRPVVERVLRNLSARTAAILREQVEGGAEAEMSLEARHLLMETAYDLEERGEISLEGPADDSIPPLDPAIEIRLDAHLAPGAGAPEAIELVVGLAERARAHGLLSLEPVLERIPEGILSSGIRMLADQMTSEEIETILGRQIDSRIEHLERNGEIVLEGLLSIVLGDDEIRTQERLVAFLPEGLADFHRMPEVRLTPSIQATTDLIRLLCDMSAEARERGLPSLEGRLGDLPDSLLRRGLKWALEGYEAEDIERMLQRRHATRLERERRLLEVLLEGILLIRDGQLEPPRIREALEGFLEEKA